MSVRSGVAVRHAISAAVTILAAALLAGAGCKESGPPAPAAPGAAQKPGAAQEPKEPGAAQPAGPTLRTDVGVDAERKVIRVGTLDDESGPGASIGIPYAQGKRILAAQINAGGTGLLPDGWTVALVGKDHGYNPQKAIQAYKETQDEVLFYGTVFGTPNTLPLRPLLERAGAVAFPASLSSELALDETTPPIGPSYRVEALRAFDWVVESAGGETNAAANVKACVVAQKDDYGKDGQEGWTAAAKHHGLTLVSEQSVMPGQKDVTAVVTALKDAGCTHVLLVVLPSGTGPIVGTAAQLGFAPVWIGNTPSWIDRFFDPQVIPPQVFASFYWVTGFPFWGEPVPGMDKFIAAWEAHGKEKGGPDFYTLVSYAQGLAQIEAARRAIEAGDITRAGYKKQLQSLKDWNAGGLIQPLDLTKFPYEASTRTRVLKPDFEKRSWQVVADWAAPQAL